MDIQSESQLAAKKCVPCEGGVPAVPLEEAREQLAKLPGWSLTADGKRIRKAWKLKNFVAGLKFFEAVGQVAEADQHHPDLHLTEYRNIAIELWTHAIDGLSENDFILAAKIDQIPVVTKS